MPKRKSRQKKLTGKGGPGRGQGRKPIGPEPRLRINITITPTHQNRAREIGAGNVSLGICRALDRCKTDGGAT